MVPLFPVDSQHLILIVSLCKWTDPIRRGLPKPMSWVHGCGTRWSRPPPQMNKWRRVVHPGVDRVANDQSVQLFMQLETRESSGSATAHGGGGGWGEGEGMVVTSAQTSTTSTKTTTTTTTASETTLTLENNKK